MVCPLQRPVLKLMCNFSKPISTCHTSQGRALVLSSSVTFRNYWKNVPCGKESCLSGMLSCNSTITRSLEICWIWSHPAVSQSPILSPRLESNPSWFLCVLQRTRGQKRKRVAICEDREDKTEVFSLFYFKPFFSPPCKCIYSSPLCF